MVSEAMNDVGAKVRVRSAAGYETRRVAGTDIAARGEPALWMLGGTLALGVLMIAGFLLLIVWNGALAFWPRPIEVMQLSNGKIIAGEPRRTESFRPSETVVSSLSQEQQAAIHASGGFAERTLYRTGNYDLYNEDFAGLRIMSGRRSRCLATSCCSSGLSGARSSVVSMAWS
jgi:phosphate transport system permease protein